MLHSIRHLNYSDRLRELWLPSLQYRRARADLIEVYKILNGIDKGDKNKLFQNQPNQELEVIVKNCLNINSDWT